MAGSALWAAFDEIRRLYETEDGWLTVPGITGPAHIQTAFTAHYLSPFVPEEIAPKDASHSIDQLPDLIENARTGQVYDQRAVGALVKDILGVPGTQLIVTDLELIPPYDWRYIIWDVVEMGVVASITPLDPAYWGIRMGARERVGKIKARTRAACASVVGSLLGLRRCDNETCYLYADVDSVLRLDDMVHLGEEHGVERLAFRGFSLLAEEPEQPAEIVSLEGLEL